MSQPFAIGKIALGLCDRCGRQELLRRLRAEVVKGRQLNNRVCPECWDKDHPQLMQGTFPIYDPQALRAPRPDGSFVAGGQYSSRDIQWGWRPVGGAFGPMAACTPNDLVAIARVGTVTVG